MKRGQFHPHIHGQQTGGSLYLSPSALGQLPISWSQLGKFRQVRLAAFSAGLTLRYGDQWAGEKIYARDKTVVVEDELKELEQDIELRKQGIIRYVLCPTHCRPDTGSQYERQIAGSFGRLLSCAFKEEGISIFWTSREAHAARCAWDSHGHARGRVW